MSTSVQSLSKMMSLDSMEKFQQSVETHDSTIVPGQERVSALINSSLEDNFAPRDDISLSKTLQEPSTVLEITGDSSAQSQCGGPAFLNFDGLMNSNPSSPTEHAFHSNFNNNSNAGGVQVNTSQSSPFQDVPRKRIRASVPAVCQKSTIEATLEGKALWDEFCRRGTEMIVNRAGRRMFPGFSVAINSLKPKAKYSMKLEVVLADNHRFKFLNSRWLAVGSAEPQPLSESYLHPDSPNSGAFWMRHGVSFRKLKITNNKERPGNNALLYSMHKYFLRLVVEEERKLSPGEEKVLPRVVLCLDFPETTFVAVTAYQNEEVTQLKITNNPFAKAFRENAADMDWETSQLLYSSNQTSFTPLPQRAVDHFSGGYWPFSSPTLAPLPPPLSPLSGYVTHNAAAPTMGYSSSAVSSPFPPASSSFPFASSTVPHGQNYFQWPAATVSHNQIQNSVLPNPFSVYHKVVENSSSVGVNLPDFETVFTTMPNNNN